MDWLNALDPMMKLMIMGAMILMLLVLWFTRRK